MTRGRLLLVPAAASAADIQIGVTASPMISPTCPANAQGKRCAIVLTQVTAYETLRDGVVNPDHDQAVRRDLVVHARPGGHEPDHPDGLAYLDKTYGGPPEAQLTALLATGTPAHPAYRVAAESPSSSCAPSWARSPSSRW